MEQKQRILNTALLTILLMLLCLFGSEKPAFATKKSSIRRFAFIVGANDGGHERAQLRYANSDATAFANVLMELGGVARQDLLLVTDANRQALTDGFKQLTRMLKEAQNHVQKTEVLFYYSGHSDERGLLLRNSIYSYKEMKRQIDIIPARIRIGVLDSCASGTLVRLKGGRRTAPFLIDSSSKAEGVAFITSASADESAQESDSVGGSYFTHFFVTGLRGAADVNRDGRVTLTESYAYAFDETLYRTADTQAGPQHPNYDFRLTGTGDLVLTDLRQTNAMMIFASEIKGRIFVRDGSGNLIAEINKRSKRPIKLGIQPGKYEVFIISSGALKRARVRVTTKRPTRINSYTGKLVSSSTTATKGSETIYTTDEKAQRYRPVAVGILPGVTTNGQKATLNSFALNILGKGHSLTGMEVSLWANIRTNTTNGLQLSNLYNDTGSLYGVQYALVNVSHHQTQGFQAGAINIGHTTQGVQAGTVNFNGDKFVGYQGGVVNITVDLEGLQTGLTNIQSGEMRGLQLALVNFAASFNGMQLGVANINRFYFRGVQLGLLNFSKSTNGVQLGLMNIALGDFKGAQIGFLNYAGNGILAPVFWVSDTVINNTAIKLGNRYTYGMIGGSSTSLGSRKATTGILVGFGVHLEFHPVWMEGDVIFHRLGTLDDDSDANQHRDRITKLRWTIGYRLLDQVSFFTGPTLNFLSSEHRTGISPSPTLSFAKYDTGNTHHEFSLGMIAGFQWEPKWNEHNSWRGKK